MMIETKQPVKEVENFQRTWLKACEMFGDLVEANTLKTIALKGFQEFGRGVVCLALHHARSTLLILSS